MWKLLFILLVLLAIWKYNPSFNFNINPDIFKQNATQSIQKEKTVESVLDARKRMNKEAQDALNY